MKLSLPTLEVVYVQKKSSSVGIEPCSMERESRILPLELVTTHLYSALAATVSGGNEVVSKQICAVLEAALGATKKLLMAVSSSSLVGNFHVGEMLEPVFDCPRKCLLARL